MQPYNRSKAWYCAYVPGAGVEPARYCYHWCLRPTRLPIPPPRQGGWSGNKRGREWIRTTVKGFADLCLATRPRDLGTHWWKGLQHASPKPAPPCPYSVRAASSAYSLLQVGQGLDVSQSSLFCAHGAPCITSTLACFRLGFVSMLLDR